MRAISTAIALAFFAATSGYAEGTFQQSATAPQEPSIWQALGALKSGQEQDRSAAKRYLLGAGGLAIDPLVSLLRAALDTINTPPVVAGGVGAAKASGPPLTFSEHLSLYTAWRLVGDCCEILGALRATRAIPLLIETIEVNDPEPGLHGCGGHTDASKALARIGKPAESALIEEMKNAPLKAESSVRRTEAWIKELRGRLSGAGAPSAERPESAEDAARLLSLRCERAYRIQVQVGCALQRMGDEGTIRALEEVLESDADLCDRGKSVIESTISGIRMRPSFYLNGQN